MIFVCDQCKQKYKVGDEKVRGRDVARFRCKKCNHLIEMRVADMQAGTSDGTDAHSAAPEPAEGIGPGPTIPRAAPVPRPTGATGSPRSQPAPLAPVPRPTGSHPRPPAKGSGAPAQPIAPAPRPASPLRSSLVGLGHTSSAPAPVPSAPSSAQSPTPSGVASAPEHAWFAGIDNRPTGPLGRRDLSARVREGKIHADTLLWREGYDDWRPLAQIAELADLLEESKAVAVAAAAQAPAVAAPVPTAVAAPVAPAPGAGSAAGPASSPVPAATAATAAAPTSQPAQTAVVVPVAEPQIATSGGGSKGLPPSVVVLAAGLLVAGLGGGVMLARVTSPAPVVTVVPVQTAPAAPAAPAVPTPNVAAQLQVPTAAPAAPMEAPPVAAPAAGSPSSGSRTARNTAAASHREAPTPQPSAPPPVSPGLNPSLLGGPGPRGPSGTSLLNNSTEADTPVLTGTARASQVARVLNSSDVVRNCWQAALRRNPSHPAERFNVRIDVTSTGRGTVEVSNAADADLGNCIKNRARVLPYGVGGEISWEGSYSLTAGGS